MKIFQYLILNVEHSIHIKTGVRLINKNTKGMIMLFFLMVIVIGLYIKLKKDRIYWMEINYWSFIINV